MAREFQLMVFLYHLRLVKLILVNHELMGNIAFISKHQMIYYVLYSWIFELRRISKLS